MVLFWTIHKTAATTTPTLLTSLLDCAISPKIQENHIINAIKMYQYPNLYKLHKPFCQVLNYDKGALSYTRGGLD